MRSRAAKARVPWPCPVRHAGVSLRLRAPQRKAEDKARKEKQHAGGVTRHGTHDGEAPGDVAHRKKGRSAGGKMTKITKARGKK